MIDTKARPALPVSRNMRMQLGLPENRYDRDGRLTLNSPREARELANLIGRLKPGTPPLPSDLYGAAFICTAWRLILDFYAGGKDPFERGALTLSGDEIPPELRDQGLKEVVDRFPFGTEPPETPLPENILETARDGLSGREAALRTWTLAHLSGNDPAFAPFRFLFDPGNQEIRIGPLWKRIESIDPDREPREPEGASPLATLRKPVDAAPDSVRDQLMYILSRWGSILGAWIAGIVGALDMIEEETRPRFGGPGPAQRPGLADLDENARFSHDDAWMPRVVLLAKNILVWLHQLSQQYGREIRTLDAVPDEELATLSRRGFNALWLIGLWQRSNASREIKRRMGNPEAAASAYSLYGYDISGELGGWSALENLRHRAGSYGIRLSSDMVPNHVGLDSDWVRHHPGRLLGTNSCPFPGYSFHSDNLSEDPDVEIRLEDHYWNRSDAAVVFRRIDRRTGDTRFIYHGNDGTTMPWNDTAQIDFLNPEAREAVMQDILHVARNFSIIRFDAAMVLARKHIRRLWFPAPGAGGAIPSRSEHSMSDDEFLAAIPREFWREVVDRVAEEVPGTLLLAEAFWMMEGFFVRVLGMHRVYNSAFMNMLRDGKNDEYRGIIKETLAFDPGILQRFVNFMNNPDEATAVDQFGRDDRYFAACTLLATLPGLPMFGHGQIEGFSEKYGMEYVRAYRDETPDHVLVSRHEREIFPLLGHRALFAGAVSFRLFDLIGEHGVVESVFAYTNSDGSGRALVIVNNAWEQAAGRIHRAAPVNTGHMRHDDLATALELDNADAGDWLLMKEHNTGLWYLRQVGGLRSDGLGVMIDGYGRQVYFDFRVERETADGTWGRLASELDGRGVVDPWAAFRAIRLRPIHEALDAIITDGLIEELADTIRRGKRVRWPASREDFADCVLRLAEEHFRLSGDPREKPDTGSILNLMTSRLNRSAVLWRLSGQRVRRRIRHFFGPVTWDEAKLLVLWSLLGSLTIISSRRPPGDIRKLWGLDLWFTERRPDPGDLKISRLAGMLLTVNGWYETVRTGTPALPLLMAAAEVREVCGVNTWDGVVWYDRDGWYDCARALGLSAAADADTNRRSFGRRRRVIRLLGRWSRADRTAGYRLERLIATDPDRPR